MQVLTTMTGYNVNSGYRGEDKEMELIYKAALGDVEAKLQLVKQNLDLIVELAARYVSETGRSFIQMVQVGALAVIKAAEEFQYSRQAGFDIYVRKEIKKAMEGMV